MLTKLHEYSKHFEGLDNAKKGNREQKGNSILNELSHK